MIGFVNTAPTGAHESATAAVPTISKYTEGEVLERTVSPTIDRKWTGYLAYKVYPLTIAMLLRAGIERARCLLTVAGKVG